MVDGFGNTPRYVLKDGAHPLFPTVLQPSSGVHAAAIFGFSSKSAYDSFWQASSEALTPYPLVKGYLQNQVGLEAEVLRLVVLDALAPLQPILYAATFQAVLECIRLGSDTVAISHQMVLTAPDSAYQIQAFSNAAPEPFVS